MKKSLGISLLLTLGVGVTAALLLATTSRPQGVNAGEPARSDAAPSRPGQTLTLLSDGRWLLVGGNGPAGPVATAALWDPQTHTLTLYGVVDVTGTLTINGPSVSVTITTPGQNARLTFSGTASQQVTVRLTSNTIGTVTVKLFKPDTTALTSTTSNAANFNLATQTLPTTGTYTVVVDPSGTNTGSLTVSVTSP